MNLLIVVNSSVNFVIYCVVENSFREELLRYYLFARIFFLILCTTTVESCLLGISHYKKLDTVLVYISVYFSQLPGCCCTSSIIVAGRVASAVASMPTADPEETNHNNLMLNVLVKESFLVHTSMYVLCNKIN